MHINKTTVRVRYGETDQMGVVHHANYANFFEIGRTEWLRAFGFSYKYMENNGIMLPVVSLNVVFKRPAHYDELLTIKTTLKNAPTASIEFDYELSNESGGLLATGYTKLAFINMKTNRPNRCPKYLLDKLQNTI